MKKNTDTLYVGIDLGTSRTAIAADNGIRRDVFSCVGKPKDLIAKKLFGGVRLQDGLLFGQEALDQRMSLDLIRPLEKGVIRSVGDSGKINTDAVRSLLKHALSLVGAKPGQTVRGVIGAPARASVESKQLILEAADGVLDSVMVASEPFAVAYGIGALSDTLILDIGAGTMDLCRMHGTFPTEEDQISIDKAGDHIDEVLFDAIRLRYPEAQFSTNMIKKVKEAHGYVSVSGLGVQPVTEVEFPVMGRPTLFDITEPLREACCSILPGLLKAVNQLIGSFDPEFQSRLRNNVLVCGGGSQLPGLGALIEEGLLELGGGHVTVVDEPIFAGAGGALQLASEMPDSFWEQIEHAGGVLSVTEVDSSSEHDAAHTEPTLQ